VGVGIDAVLSGGALTFFIGLGAEGEALQGMVTVTCEWKPSWFLFLGDEAKREGEMVG
jgi:hypothetical protein